MRANYYCLRRPRAPTWHANPAVHRSTPMDGARHSIQPGVRRDRALERREGALAASCRADTVTPPAAASGRRAKRRRRRRVSFCRQRREAVLLLRESCLAAIRGVGFPQPGVGWCCLAGELPGRQQPNRPDCQAAPKLDPVYPLQTSCLTANPWSEIPLLPHYHRCATTHHQSNTPAYSLKLRPKVRVTWETQKS